MTAAEGIPEGFRSDESGRVAPGGKEARSPGIPRWRRGGRLESQFETAFLADQFVRRYLSIPAAIFLPSAMAQEMNQAHSTLLLMLTVEFHVPFPAEPSSLHLQ